MKKLILILPFLIAACSEAQRNDLTRDAAKRTVKPVLAERFPGVPLEPATDCVIDNANSNEILSLAGDAITGPTASTVEIVARIMTRPETIECLAREGLPAILG